jgi:hypothetical protein
MEREMVRVVAGVGCQKKRVTTARVVQDPAEEVAMGVEKAEVEAKAAAVKVA